MQECNRERKGRIISTYNSPKSTVGRKGEKKEKGASEREGAREREREGESVCERERERERERQWKKKFFSPPPPPPSLYLSLHHLPLSYPGSMEQEPKSAALRLGRAGRTALPQLWERSWHGLFVVILLALTLTLFVPRVYFNWI